MRAVFFLNEKPCSRAKIAFDPGRSVVGSKAFWRIGGVTPGLRELPKGVFSGIFSRDEGVNKATTGIESHSVVVIRIGDAASVVMPYVF